MGPPWGRPLPVRGMFSLRPITVHLDRLPIVFQITAVVSLLLVLILAACLITVSIVLTDAIRGNAGGHMESIAIDLADRLDDGMLERYQDVVSLTTSDPFTQFEQGRGAEVQARIDALKASFPHYAWIGLADRNGSVIAASDGVLAGTSVAEHPWFVAGAAKAHIGRVHEAALLAALLKSKGADADAEPLRLIDVAAPVKDSEGRQIAVLGAHLSWDWARELRDTALTDQRKALKTEMRIADRQGRLVLGGAFGSSFGDLGSVKAALAGKHGWMIEQIDGSPQLVGFAPTHGFAEMDGLGWIVMASTPLAVADAPLHDLDRVMGGIGVLLGLAGILIVFLTAKRLGRPLTTLTEVARGIGQDTPHTLPRLSGSREVVSLSLALRALLHRIGAVTEHLQDTRERAAALESENRELEQLASLDPLTGLRNRRSFLELAEHEIARARRDASILSVLMIDIDHFKQVNDTYGHPAGDKVIRAIANLIRSLSREADIAARFGGEEFVILLPNCGFEDVRQFGERLRLRISEHLLEHDGRAIRVTVSVGCAHFTPQTTGLDEAIDSADHALYLAKRLGRNRVEGGAI